MVVRRNLKRESLVVLELRGAIQREALNAKYGELDLQDFALLAVYVVAGCAEDGADKTVGECFSMKACGVNGGTFVPGKSCSCGSFRIS